MIAVSGSVRSSFISRCSCSVSNRFFVPTRKAVIGAGPVVGAVGGPIISPPLAASASCITVSPSSVA